MICVSLGRTRHKMVIAEHKHLASRGAQLVELRLDWLSHSPDVGRLLAGRPTPVVVTCRRARDKGLWRWTEEQRLMVLRSAIVSGAEYVDLEEDIAGSIRRFGPTKRIVSHHDFDKTPDDLEEIFKRLLELDPDIVKIVTMANSPLDNVRVLKLAAGSKVPTIAFCMGEFGVPSRILTGRYGAPFTYATFSSDRAMAPGQLTFEETRDIYHYDQINAATEVYGVIADPVAHSMSPLVHNAAFVHERLNKVYLPFRVPKDALAETVAGFGWLPVKGYSVTLPHKEEVLSLTSRFDGPIRDIGAANTLFQGTDGSWHAANTDYDAALESLVRELNPDPEAGTDVNLTALAGRKVLLLGAGGVARAIGRGIVSHGGVLMISNRTKDRAAELAEQLGCLLIEWQNRGSVFADVLVNCTSVGMHHKLDETPFADNWLREGMVV
ncbi:MAG: type I 3-dehydroquinate dehydratase, partial [Planctomycetia bacterium]|nr:type I 3-dehydroquinate dehydratase [Planctomycetia bacterium]